LTREGYTFLEKGGEKGKKGAESDTEEREGPHDSRTIRNTGVREDVAGFLQTEPKKK